MNPSSNPIPSAPATAGFDISSLRIPATYGTTLGVTKLLTNVLVGKPKKPTFFRTPLSEAMSFRTMVLEQKESRESYLVSPDVAQELNGLVRAVMLYAAIDRQNNPFLIPVPLPGEDGNLNPWHDSLGQAVVRARKVWLRISANMQVGAYDIYIAEGTLPEPEWPDHDMDALVQIAFRGKIITSLDHPVVQSLLGKI